MLFVFIFLNRFVNSFDNHTNISLTILARMVGMVGGITFLVRHRWRPFSLVASPPHASSPVVAPTVDQQTLTAQQIDNDLIMFDSPPPGVSFSGAAVPATEEGFPSFPPGQPAYASFPKKKKVVSSFRWRLPVFPGRNTGISAI